MNVQRAKEIASSPVMANVMCDGTPIYIQHVDEQNETARIYPLGNPQDEREVPLYSLSEQDGALE
ncbi:MULTISPECIES: small acid-soluble spore protein H [Paenibacillus]|uniref:Small, acid-soluble spore protein H n=1 Tax=Paenibacillus albilobatus TaxID=2716884 RepID=A0A920CAU0_9BACL|nr:MULTISPECIES: small acid-soluble spore protein H [Paenibacillus]MDR9854209.1 small acid-soluble spore protein H [Paenibacillus sp. VCA1]GIO31273.1 small, acid-soluble spore protein H [Paenibacillus albilobatus]